jgi:asparagine synthase (glutamine-hydrolysing)
LSGIVGIVNLDGQPVDPALLARMTASLAFRGPDAQRVWNDGAVGFGFTLLKTTDESEQEHQPLTLDGNVSIVADARVDARGDLIEQLRARGHEVAVAANVPDVELILRAYRVWGERCVEHLRGDFAFAVWDARRRRLFLARDQMGIKPLFYSSVGSSLVFSNALDCVRCHPAVSDRLNDLAMADFLLFDQNEDKATTAFADIQRVPPAHSATRSAAGMQLHRYWTLPIDEPIFYRRWDEYVERFNELLRLAVADRLRTDRIGVFMSGGLDSPTLATTARDLLRDRPGQSGVRAFTTTYEGYDQERHYAELVARGLEIPIDFQSWDPDTVDPEWNRTAFHTPEPVPYPVSLAADWAYHRKVASYGRVVFNGEGPDNALRYEWRPYLTYLARRRHLGVLLKDLWSHVVLHRRIPVPASIFAILTRYRPNEAAGTPFPDWFNPDFERRLQLRRRWKESQVEPPPLHLVRPQGYRSLDLPLWQGLFDGFDVAYTRSLLEVRHPFVDLRLLRYLLAVPAIPWCRGKYLLRRAMRGRLPKSVLRRPKSPLVRDPWTDRVLECGLPPLIADPRLETYVDTTRVPGIVAGNESRFWLDLRPRALNYWLRNLNLGQNEEGLAHGSGREAGTSLQAHEKGVQPASTPGLR